MWDSLPGAGGKMAVKNLGKMIFEGPNTEHNEIREDDTIQGCVLDQA